MSKVRDSFQHWLNILFLEDELEEIVQCCYEEEELGFEVQKMFLIFLDKAPRAIVLPYRNEYFDIIKDVE